MTYRYKRSDNGETIRHKAWCTIRGDRIKPYTNFDPDRVSTDIAERPSTRTTMYLAAAFHHTIEQFDFSSAFLNERYEHSATVYIQQIPRFDGKYKNPLKISKLIGNMCGTPSASHKYFNALKKYLKSSQYKKLTEIRAFSSVSQWKAQSSSPLPLIISFSPLPRQQLFPTCTLLSSADANFAVSASPSFSPTGESNASKTDPYTYPDLTKSAPYCRNTISPTEIQSRYPTLTQKNPRVPHIPPLSEPRRPSHSAKLSSSSAT